MNLGNYPFAACRGGHKGEEFATLVNLPYRP